MTDASLLFIMTIVRVPNLTRIEALAPAHSTFMEFRYGVLGSAVRGNAIDMFRFAVIKYDVIPHYTLHIGRFQYSVPHNLYSPAPQQADCLGYNIVQNVNLSISDGTLIKNFFSEINSKGRPATLYKHPRPHLDFLWQNKRLENTLRISYEDTNNDTCLIRLPIDLLEIFCNDLLPQIFVFTNNHPVILIDQINDSPPPSPA